MFGNWTATELRSAALKHEEMARRYRELADLLDQTKEFVTQELPYKTRERRKNFRMREIVGFLQRQKCATASEIHEECRIPLQTVYWVCNKLRKEGRLGKNDQDKWILLTTSESK